MITFVDKLRSGQITDIHEEFDEAVGEWHDANTDLELHEWLGMTFEEYIQFLENPGGSIGSIRHIVELLVEVRAPSKDSIPTLCGSWGVENCVTFYYDNAKKCRRKANCQPCLERLSAFTKAELVERAALVEEKLIDVCIEHNEQEKRTWEDAYAEARHPELYELANTDL